MPLIVVDVEADGPCPGKHSMVCFGAIVVEETLGRTFYGQTSPISGEWNPEALAISGISRAEHEKFTHPPYTMEKFKSWVNETSRSSRPVFISDNLAFDWQFINYYFHCFTDGNPFGWSGRRIGDLYCGLEKDARARWKHLRQTKHTHNPVDDARGNAEVLLQFGHRIKGLIE